MRVLLVDDSKTERVSLRQPLELAGWQVVEADSGVSALKLLQQNEVFDLMISDQNMPNMSGTTLLKTLRDEINSVNRMVKVIFLTSDSSVDIRRDCSDLGASAYVLKPVNAEALVKVAKKVAGV